MSLFLNPIIKTAPAAEPVDTDEARAWLRVDHNADDGLIEALITAARLKAESYTNRAFITTELQAALDKWPCAGPAGSPPGTIELPRAPLIWTEAADLTVKYMDPADTTGATLITLTKGTDYDVDKASEPGRIYPCYGTTWPAPLPVPGAVQLTWKAGYGATAAAVPETIKTAIKLILTHLYQYRGDTAGPNGAPPLPDSVTDLLDTVKIWSI